MAELNVLVKPASGLCNMKCGYCFYADEMENRSKASCGMMQEDVMEQVIKKSLAFATNRCSFMFQGGEPALAGLPFYRKWMEYERKYNVNHVEISHAIQTNGYALNGEWCRFFAENGFMAGLSLDGIMESHDAYRKDACGNGTYTKVLAAAAQLRAAQVEFNVLTVVNGKTAPLIREIYDTYREQGFLWQQYIACLDPMGKEAGSMEYSLTPERYGEFLTELFRLWEEDVWNGRQPYIRQFENYIGILLGAEPESCEQRGRCSFQNVVEADGSVYPCDFYVLDEYRIGNVTDDGFDFRDIIEKYGKGIFGQQSREPAAACAGCKYFFICRGGCRRHRQRADGRNYFCKSYRMFFDACLAGMQEIAAWVLVKRGEVR